MSRALLVDADGVIIRPRQKYFSEKFSKDHNVPLDKILPFFKNEYREAIIGKVDSREVLPPYLKKWNWEKSLEDFLAYWFESERNLDNQLLKLISNLRQKGIKCYLASDNEVRRAEYLREEVGLKEYFDNMFFSSDLGATKSEKVFFKQVLKELSLQPSEVIFWDDDPKNIKTAKSIGIEGYVYGDYGEFVRKMDKLFPEEMKTVFAFDTDDFYCDLVFSGRIKIQKIRETENILAFYHTRPSWSTHIVIVPKKHVSKLTDLKEMSLIKEIFSIAKEIILENNWDEKNYRIITNGGSFQDSKHLHFHLVSGEKIK